MSRNRKETEMKARLRIEVSKTDSLRRTKEKKENKLMISKNAKNPIKELSQKGLQKKVC